MSEPTLQDRFHLIDIGGAGMSVAAKLLAPRDATIEGSDREESAVLEHLRSVGVRAFIGHEASHVDPSSVVVVPTAIREDNPELATAHERGQRIIHRSQVLALAASGMRFVGVAGAREKTTTSGMLAISLSICGRDPSVTVGGMLPRLGTGARLGGEGMFVARADESDGLFLGYTPAIEVVTNIESDRLDRYRSREGFEGILVKFVRRMAPGGLLVTCAEGEDAVRLAQSACAEGLRIATYGRRGYSLCTPSVMIAGVRVEAQGAGVSLAWGELSASLALGVPGEHNVLNAAAAWVVGTECDLSPQAVADGLDEFTGATRRFEARSQVDSRHLFDDYAYHLMEVEAVIREARVVAGESDVTVAFQLHLYSRTRIFAERFAQALSGTDHIVLASIYDTREDPEPGADSSLTSSHIEDAFYVEDMHEVTHLAASLTPEGGVYLTMGAGSITRCASDALSEWRWMEA